MLAAVEGCVPGPSCGLPSMRRGPFSPNSTGRDSRIRSSCKGGIVVWNPLSGVVVGAAEEGGAKGGEEESAQLFRTTLCTAQRAGVCVCPEVEY